MGTQLNAFILFIIAWSTILIGALRGAGDTYGVMTISATFCGSMLIIVLIHLFELPPTVVFGIHVFGSPLLLFTLTFPAAPGKLRLTK